MEMGEIGRIFHSASACTYTKCYCEENVWHLCKSVRTHHSEELSQSFAVFISNHNKTVPLWCQKAAEDPDQPVIWDYHVIFIHQSTDATLVYDLDTTLPFPCEFHEYITHAIKPHFSWKEKYHRLFRVIPAKTFLDRFSSDRSHMLKADMQWLSPPPTYPCIATSESSNNLPGFIDMTRGSGHGSVMDLNQFCLNFS